MPYDSQIERADAQSLMPEEVQREIVQGISDPSLYTARSGFTTRSTAGS